MISQRHFHVHIGNKKSRCRTLINGVLQGYVLAPALFNLYTYDLPETQSLFTLTTLLYFIVTLFSVIERTLYHDLDKLREYFRDWRLKLNAKITVCSAFHLTNRLANYKLQVRTRGQLIPLLKCDS